MIFSGLIISGGGVADLTVGAGLIRGGGAGAFGAPPNKLPTHISFLPLIGFVYILPR